jgi:hypothetical protein
MEGNMLNENNITKIYLDLRKQLLRYSNLDMNLALENDRQVYVAIFDIPIDSYLVGFQTETLALVFGLNTHIYHGSGEAITGLEQDKEVMKAMQSLFISCPQVIDSMRLVTNIEYYESNHIRAYLKTKSGIYFKELLGESKEDKFLFMLMNNILSKVLKIVDE